MAFMASLPCLRADPGLPGPHVDVAMAEMAQSAALRELLAGV